VVVTPAEGVPFVANPDATFEVGAAVVAAAHMAMVSRKGAGSAADMHASQATDMRSAKPAAAHMAAREAAADMAAATEAAAPMAAATEAAAPMAAAEAAAPMAAAEAAAPVATAATTTVATAATTAPAPTGQGVGRYRSGSQRDSRDQDDCSM
jgi:hypothetical protein